VERAARAALGGNRQWGFPSGAQRGRDRLLLAAALPGAHGVWVYDRTQSVLPAIPRLPAQAVANWPVAIVPASGTTHEYRMLNNSETSVNDINLSPACDLMIIFSTVPAGP
jgi:hypothetical protein